MAKRKGAPEFKPCDQLTVLDFRKHPLWGFDLDMEGGDGADESWIRPYVFRSMPSSIDVLFAQATVRSGDGPVRAGAVSFRVERSRPAVVACVLLEPRYCAVGLSLGKSDLGYLKSVLGKNFGAHFPLSYEAVLELGPREFPVSGRIDLPGRSGR